MPSPAGRSALLALVLLLAGGTVAPAPAAAADGTDRAARILATVEPPLSPRATARLLAEDDAVRVGEAGVAYYVDEPSAAESLTGPPTVAPAAAYPLADTFALHSRPAATRKIYLDFDGASVVDSLWNLDLGVANGTHPPFDTDGAPGSFSTTELEAVQAVWQRVAEDFAAYDVDVTTQDPGTAGLVRALPGDQSYGMRVVITSGDAARATICVTCTGVAFVDVFHEVQALGLYQPAWVFAGALRGDPVQIAETASHEVGHTLGLSHDGEVGGSDYYLGQGIWSPIMGYSYGALTQWSLGEYAAASNTEDDLRVFVDRGLPLRPDDHGDVPAAATAATAGAAGRWTADGVVATRTDRDVVAVETACAGRLEVVGTNAPVGPNLDLRLRLLDASGAVRAVADPPSGPTANRFTAAGLDATLVVADLPAGRWYVEVDGVGAGDPRTTGYSDYASVGQWRTVVTGCAGPAEPTGGTGSTGGTPEPTGGTTDPVTEDPTGGGTTGGTTGEPTVEGPTAPAAPSATARSGARGGRSTASVAWSPSGDGADVSGFRVVALKVSSTGRVVDRLSRSTGPDVRRLVLTATGRWRFTVQAVNDAGSSPAARTAVVRAR